MIIKSISYFFGNLIFLLASLTTFSSGRLNDVQGAKNWHQWRGPEANGVSRTAAPPMTWSESENIRWKVPIDGRGVSSPVVWGNKIFLLSSVNTGEVDASLPKPEDQPERVFGIKHPNTKYSFVVLCLDRKTGKEIWRRAATDLVPHEGHHKDNSFASASPFTDGKRLYCWFGSAGLYCFDLDGNKLWSKDLGRAKVGASLGEGCSPVVHDGKVVILRDNQGQSTIEALDAASGDPLWKKERDEPNGWSTPLIVPYQGKTQVITCGDNLIRSYDLENGSIIWQCGGLSQNTIPCPVTDGERVYCMSGYSGYSLLALPLSAKGDITGSEEIVWSKSKNTPYIPSPILYDGMLGFLKSNQSLYSVLDAKTGDELIGSTRLPSIANVYSSPVGAAGRVYLTGRNGVTLVLKRGKEFEVLATNKLDDEFRASAALVGKQMLLRGSQYLYCIEEGAALNKREVSSKAVVGPKKISSEAKAEGDKSTRELLEVIARRELPKDYPGGKGHQTFVDKWFKTAGAKGAEVGQLWKEQERLFPEMKNRGESFIKILDYVRTKKNNPKAASPTGNANPHIKRKVQAEIRREPAKPLGKTGALSGRIQDLAGKAMSGVMVSVFDDSRRQSTSVFSQLDGSFRIEGLHESSFKIRARQPGQQDGWVENVTLGKDSIVIKMSPATGEDLEEQRPASDAFGQLSFDSPRDRLNFKMMCAYCHQIGTVGFRTPERPVDWETMIRRMDGFGGLYPHTKETITQRIIDTYKDDAVKSWPAYVPPPAPSGMVAKAKITAWEMGEPFIGSFHDLEVGDDGLAYVVHIGKQYTATLDPETGERIYYRLPRGSHGPHSIEPDNDGEMWLTLCVSGEMAKFDLETKEYTILSSAEAPAERGSWPHTLRIDPKDPDGFIWYTDAGRNSVFRLHPKTLVRKEYQLLEAGQVKAGGKGESKGITPYGLDYSPVDGMIWYSKLNGNRIGRIDPKAPDGDVTEWNPPFRGPRRLHVAPDGMIWVPGFGSGVFGKFDPKTEKWTTYPLPDYLNQIPYALNVAPDGMVWICGTGNDTLYRFNPKTEYLVEFPLPFRVSYTREIEFDKEGNVWTSTSGPARHMENACGTVIKLEILDDLNEETGGMKLSPIKLSLAEQGIASKADRVRVAKVKKAGENATKLIQSGKFDSAPFDAVDFALKVKNLEGRRSALSAAFGRLGGGVGGMKIEVVEKRINSIGSSQNKDYAINGFSHGLVAKDPERALKWANSIKDEGFRKIVVRNVSRRIKSQPANSRKSSQKSMEEKTGIHRLDSPKRAPFDAFVYVNRIPDKPREGESPKDFAGRIHGRLANQEGRVQLKLPPGMDLAAYDGFKSFLGSEGNPAISNCMACHSGPEFAVAQRSLRNHKKTGAELQAIIRGKMAKATNGDQSYAGLKITDAEVAGLVSFLQSLNDVSDKRFRDLVLEARVTDVTKKPKPKNTEGPKSRPLLKGTIRFEGPRPKRIPIHMDEPSRKLHKTQPLDESVLISKSGGLANVFVYVKNPPSGEYKPPIKPAILDQKGSIFTPRVQAVRVGQELMMKNGDPFIHNVRSLSRKNRQFNIAQPQGSPDRKKTFDQAEGPIILKCDFHRWMEAHLWVMDHPFYAVANTEGEFEILDLPPGDYEISAWHEKLGEQSQKITVRKGGSVSNFKFRVRSE
ncbi:MAG: PQQ-binding-like beta-propeller repeat protein [Akkermansiaceae bacterium]|nr:PQQ-binding-like beta-propeller repeat protein [Akkermansiaceae bacterium]